MIKLPVDFHVLPPHRKDREAEALAAMWIVSLLGEHWLVTAVATASSPCGASNIAVLREATEIGGTDGATSPSVGAGVPTVDGVASERGCSFPCLNIGCVSMI